MKKLAILTLVLATGFSLSHLSFAQEVTTYAIDQAHSTIGFAVKHMTVSTTRGNFTDFTGEIDMSDDMSQFSADATIQVASIDTDNENRDNHLRSADFFDSENYPTISFTSNTLKKTDAGYEIAGDLTIKDVTKPITIPVEIAGPVTNQQGKKVIGITGETTINRQDYNVSWSKVLDTGGLVVSDEVKIIVEIEAAQ